MRKIMKKIKLYIDILLFLIVSIFKIILQIVVEAIGLVLIPFFLFRTETARVDNEKARILPSGKLNRKFKDGWFDAIFGNKNDGIYGDWNYWFANKRKPSYINAYIWTAIRNPIHNLSLKMGVDDLITDYKEYHLTKHLVYSIAIGTKGKYRLLRYQRSYKFFGKCKHCDCYIGYKNFNVKNQELPKYFQYQFAIKLNLIRSC